MYCVINGYGAVIRRKQNRFVIESEGEIREFPASDLRQILLSDAATVTTGAMALAAGNGTDIAVIGRDGRPVCRLVPCSVTGTAATRKNQVLFSSSPEGYSFIASIIRAKLFNMGSLIQALGRRRDRPDLVSEGETIRVAAAGVPPSGILPDDAPLLRGIEGEASRRYFQALAHVLPPDSYHGTRTHRPAEDVFNAALNYGYGILYNEVEKSCLLAGLDPGIGILHADRYGKTPFVYDVIEQFRQPVVDRGIITLAVRGRLRSDGCDERGYLTQDARKVIIAEVVGRLTLEQEIDGRETTFSSVILDNMREAVHSINEGRPYTPFTRQWS
ncbi:hypothetical protein RJ53_09375 [Methanocalculus chunghsingensis]|uniref:CRISPR-associated endonuclease Cas1 n=1 Tax=Methanocalculus chunghsingensis TaxID=156457 RepID=A0A8J8B601_9EURY|nr:CRISPR-associated endonuclease Cas1 [Methanocalculus chunghsingensis]MBR1369673.1 hypothetical protein [Methanocalculus chunghsingensis]